MIQIKRKFIHFFCLANLCLFSQANGQSTKSIPQKDFKIYYSYINFHFNDSIYPYTLFTEPDGLFYFKESFLEYPDSVFPNAKIKLENKQVVAYTEFFLNRNKNIDLISYFPLLIKNDSSFINEYDFEYTPYKLIYELKYSYILEKLGESSLYSCSDRRSIRIVIDDDKKLYQSIRVDFENGNAKLTYSVANFDSLGNLNYSLNKYCSINPKFITNLEKCLEQIDFPNENYFTKANLDIKYLIEYRNGANYYAIRRPYYTHDRKANRRYSSLYMVMHNLNYRCNK